jgi:predicted ATPase/DNA-binding CsgD family transcriptional regulator
MRPCPPRHLKSSASRSAGRRAWGWPPRRFRPASVGPREGDARDVGPRREAPLTDFIGRTQERAEVAQLLSVARLVTLVGAGGVGKTRLAVEVAASVAHGFAGGVDFVDLAPVRDEAAVPAVVARSLGLEEWGEAPIEDRLARLLRTQRRLVVLDNCEHLRVGCANVLSRMLSRCPPLVVLATSRESLGVPGEVTWRVPSLSFPWPERLPAVEDVESYEALALFLDRARAARPGFVVAPDEVAALTSICYHLDGIPLGLELAAARMRALSMAEIAERISGRFDLLTAGGVGPLRHQTLQASVEWSHQLLDGVEQALFRRLGVFAGGWSLEAAEAVVGGAPVAGAEVAGVLARLVDKSLVQVEESGPETRYCLLETIRVFAHQRLAEAGELDQFRQRHGEHFVRLAECSGTRVRGPGQVSWARLLDREDANQRATRAWCDEDGGRAGLGLVMAAGLWEFWHIRGRLVEAADWLTDALARAEEPLAARAEAVNGLGVIASVSGDHPRGARLFADSIAAYEQVGDLEGLSRAWTHFGNGLTLQGDVAGGEAAFARGLELAQRSGSRWHEAFAMYLWGFGASTHGDLERAEQLLGSSVAAFNEVGDGRAVAYGLTILGDCLVQRGAATEAVGPLEDAIRRFALIPERWGLLNASSLLATVEGARGNWERAALVLGVVQGLCERTGGELFLYQRQRMALVVAECESQLGSERFALRHKAGQAVGRGDGIAEALWPSRRDPAKAAEAVEAGTHPRLLPLTPRELEVAQLIAEGLTNRQIGQRLFIAERTVDTHVGRVLTKLACTRRAQVAAVVARSPTRDGRSADQ